MDVAELRGQLELAAVAEDAAPMAAYMKNRFVFLGVKAGPRRAASKAFIAQGKDLSPDGILDLADELWAEPEREFHHVGTDLARRWASTFEPPHLARVEELITTNSWWDTVDALASHVVGTMVQRHRELAEVMDDWIEDDDMWLVRTAIIHQLRFKEATDTERLFAYADRHAEHRDFFIRKAIGWALRQHARHDAVAVRDWVLGNEQRLSGLTVREALKHIGPGP